ncbi:MAG: GNAT family N-acetyltransferase [Chloroflexi bacterium]|nr:GNAT family N-acetyltransferase [Chloroflexota bacterium]
MDDLDLLTIQAATFLVLGDSGRILRKNTPVGEAAPRFRLTRCASGSVAWLRHDVGETTTEAIEGLVAREPALRHPDSMPVHLADYLRLLAAEAPVDRYEVGLNWTFPDRLDYEHPAALVGSNTPGGDRLVAGLIERGMPEGLVGMGFADVGEFWAPWRVALDGNEIASIAFTVGVGPASAEVGVATMPGFRGRGSRQRRLPGGHRSQRIADEPSSMARRGRTYPPSGSLSDLVSASSVQV